MAGHVSDTKKNKTHTHREERLARGPGLLARGCRRIRLAPRLAMPLVKTSSTH
jgi:hypothetical protein